MKTIRLAYTAIISFFVAGIAGEVSANKDLEEIESIDSVGSIHLAIERNATYRGRVSENTDQTSLGLELSSYGFSAGLRQIDQKQSDLTAYFVSYSYNFNVFNLSVGAQRDDPILKRDEAFVEIIVPAKAYVEAKISYFHAIEGKGSDYLDFQVSRPWVLANGQWMAKPYALISAGDYYADDFSFNHFEIGADVTYMLTKNLFLSAYGSLVTPLENVKDAGFESDTKVNGGLILRYTF
ncbi:MAG: hypothetical protein H6985_06145 [Pseudomonadales bacterium]|nr:hypothetical protein [Pseudomonadales bacterium]